MTRILPKLGCKEPLAGLRTTALDQYLRHSMSFDSVAFGLESTQRFTHIRRPKEPKIRTITITSSSSALNSRIGLFQSPLSRLALVPHYRYSRLETGMISITVKQLSCFTEVN